ncbi:MAG: glycoside hydrolase family 43 protein, partial [Flavisolibacter sp.]
VNSSFAYFPGLPIFHSRDLVSWKQIGSAMNRPEQLPLIGAGVSRGLFAPTIRYYKGLYYIVCTLVDKGGNFVITAKDPKGPWSNPAWLKNVDGIDPSLYFDQTSDKAYILYNSVPPENKPLYNGHRTIRMRSFDYKNLNAGDDETILVNGGTDLAKKPVWIEGPHIYKIKNWYYLMCAEGGTSYDHSEVVFRSKSVEGPYVSFAGNPILTQRDLDTNRKNPITSTGHADLVETQDGKWYAVFLGCRPYEGDFYNTGRETFMAPIRWRNEWPFITEASEEVNYFYPVPIPKVNSKPLNPFSGNFRYSTEFGGYTLDPRFLFLRTVNQKWCYTQGKKANLVVKLRPETISGTGNPSFVGFRQSHAKCSTMVSLQFKPAAENEKAGLTIFQNEHHFYYLCKSKEDGKPVVQIYRATNSEEVELLKTEPLPLNAENLALLIVADGATYSFYWSGNFSRSMNKTKWNLLLNGVDGKFLSTKVAGGFVGSILGMYATSLGKPSTSTASYTLFQYQGNDDVYKGR